MKSFLALALFTLSLPALAEPDDAAKKVFESVAAAWRANNAEAVGGKFDKDSKVSLTLDDSGQYSRDQAITKLTKYLKANPTKSLKLSEDGYEGTDRPSATYDYEYTDANGKKQSARLFVQLKKVDGTWVVEKISRM